jgi:hypothetical protein
MKEIKEFLERNETGETTYQNIRWTEKVVQRGKCIAIKAHIKKQRELR